jgi:hypothetical protein
MTDRYETWATGITAPAGHGFAVTAHDANDLPETTRALYVGGGGTIALVLASGATITLSGVPSGALLPIRACRVLATGTTATAMVGLI